MKKVIIIGGGVAGMTAAHELAERGFEVHVYEKRMMPGGKARSARMDGTSINNSVPLPCEHGFRFFPRFYRHLPDTMRRIPYKNNKNGVEDNLVQTSRVMIWSDEKPPITAVDRFPRNLADLRALITETHSNLGLEPGELDFFVDRLWQLMTSCKLRRERDYETTAWWNFIDGANKSKAFQEYLATGVTRSLVALQAQHASTKTCGDILLQLLFDMIIPGVSSDRVLNGPTHDVWLGPWISYLQSLGVTYNYNYVATNIDCKDGVIQKITIQQGDNIYQDGNIEQGNNPGIDLTADYYIFAVPVEVMAGLIENNAEINTAMPSLSSLQSLKADVAWMTGIQFYLNVDLELTHGHNIFIDSPWAVTAISQAQFWKDVNFSAMYDGTIKTILSVDISNWNQPVWLKDPVTGQMEFHNAMQCCSKDELADEVWKQLQTAINRPGNEILKNEYKVLYHLDRDIDVIKSGDIQNIEPLLINQTTTWYMRPEAYTNIPNLFLASDYVKTNTDLATMEGANEAARRAVNSILDASGSEAPYCEIWDLHEQDAFVAWRAHDQSRFDKGLPWNGDIFKHTLAEEAVEGIENELKKLKSKF